MEKLAPSLKKYQKEIDALASENANLERALDAAKPSIASQLNSGKQQQELIFLRQFYASVPDEYKVAHHAKQQNASL